LLLPRASDTASAKRLGCLDLPFLSGEEARVPGELMEPMEVKSPKDHFSFFLFPSLPFFLSLEDGLGGTGRIRGI
jgi:hypothetical protein